MEKATTIFSVLTHNYDFMVWFWLLVTSPLGIWPIFHFRSGKILSEDELTEISSEFKGITCGYKVYSLIAIILVIVIPLLGLAPILNQWALEKYSLEFYPWVVFITAGYGIYQGLFALVTGVYPMGRGLSFQYDNPTKIRQAAKRHIQISVAIIVLVIVFFFVTV